MCTTYVPHVAMHAEIWAHTCGPHKPQKCGTIMQKEAQVASAVLDKLGYFGHFPIGELPKSRARQADDFPKSRLDLSSQTDDLPKSRPDKLTTCPRAGPDRLMNFHSVKKLTDVLRRSRSHLDVGC